jgi:hypothetical protein
MQDCRLQEQISDIAGASRRRSRKNPQALLRQQDLSALLVCTRHGNSSMSREPNVQGFLSP